MTHRMANGVRATMRNSRMPEDDTADNLSVNRGNLAPLDEDEEGPEWDADIPYDFGDFDEEEDDDDAE